MQSVANSIRCWDHGCYHSSGKGLDAILPAIIEYIPPPKGRPDGLLKLLLFDAYHDDYRGVICLVSAHMHPTHAWLPSDHLCGVHGHCLPECRSLMYAARPQVQEG